MILLNNELFLETQEEVDLYTEDLMKQSYNDMSKKTFQIFSDYLQECHKADIRLTQMVQKNIDKALIPVVLIEVYEWSDLNSFDFTLVSADEDFELRKRQERQFYNYCNKCFGGIQGLFDRICLAFPD